MNKTWLVFRHEYLRHVLRKRFIFAILSMPLLIIVMAGIGFFSSVLSLDHTPVGLVDEAGFLPAVLPPTEEDEPSFFRDPPFIRMEDEQLARHSIEAGQIKAYYVIEADYLESGRVRMVAVDSRVRGASTSLSELLYASLLEDQPQPVIQRVLSGPDVTITSPDRSRTARSSDWFAIMFPILAGVLLMITINTSGGYLVQAVAEEKENRTMEIMVTSVSPGQLMAGKILGNLSVGLTQLAIWVIFVIVGLRVAQTFFGLAPTANLDLTSVILMLVTLLPAFVMIAALMATAGATAAEAREAQQIAGMFTLPVAVPYWFMASIMSNPDGPIATGLSLFPLSAPIALPLRAAFSIVPFWQIALSVGLLVLSAAAALWLAGRAFRMGMLRYGKTLRLGDILRRTAA